MCLAIPSKIIELDETMAKVDVYGARRDVNMMLMPEPASIGDYVLVHAGFAIQKVDEDAAIEALKLIQEMAQLLEDEGIEEDDLGDLPPYPTMPYLGN